jgi:hypothetical protein
MLKTGADEGALNPSRKSRGSVAGGQLSKKSKIGTKEAIRTEQKLKEDMNQWNKNISWMNEWEKAQKNKPNQIVKAQLKKLREEQAKVGERIQLNQNKLRDLKERYHTKRYQKGTEIGKKGGGGMSHIGLYPAEESRSGTMSEAKRKRYMKKGGKVGKKEQGYKDRKDESIAMRVKKPRTKKQLKASRDESYGKWGHGTGKGKINRKYGGKVISSKQHDGNTIVAGCYD